MPLLAFLHGPRPQVGAERRHFVGVLVLPASGATENQATRVLTRDLVVVDLDNVKHRHILRHVFDARRKGHPRVLQFAATRGLRTAATR